MARDRLLQAMGSQFYTEAVVAFLSILATATPDYRVRPRAEASGSVSRHHLSSAIALSPLTSRSDLLRR